MDAERAIIDELAGGAYWLADFGAEDLTTASDLIERYQDQNIGATDASLWFLLMAIGPERFSRWIAGILMSSAR